MDAEDKIDGWRPSVRPSVRRMPCVAGLTTGDGAVHGGHEGQGEGEGGGGWQLRRRCRGTTKVRYKFLSTCSAVPCCLPTGLPVGLGTESQVAGVVPHQPKNDQHSI